MTKTAKKTVETKATEAQAQAVSFFSNLMEASKALVAGTIEVDKAILGHVTQSAKDVAEHGKSVMGAKDIKTAFELQTAFVQNSFEQGIANTREVVELAQTKLKEAAEPFQKAA